MTHREGFERATNDAGIAKKHIYALDANRFYNLTLA